MRGFNASGLAYAAMLFAREAHVDQKRKYLGNPYSDHLAEVAGIVATVAHCSPDVAPDTMIATAWLHDTVEDTDVSIADIEERFGATVAYGVFMLSDLETGNRAERKAASRKRLACAPAWVQTIKCADLISNTASIVEHDPDFARVYLAEKRLLLAVMTGADRNLHALAVGQAKHV